ncbi:MAG: DNA-binding response regulator [Cytophagales bacterium]|nr:MAG: DNA-binding response regulator [Cytophagales bacterium]
MKAKILLAEDDNNFAMMLKFFLETHHFEVVWCENGELAIQQLQSNLFDLCILDIMMPQKDGFMVAEKLNKIPNPIPFVFLSAKALKEDQIKGYQLGATDYLIKPFDPEILLYKIQALVKKQTEKTTVKSFFHIGSYVFDPEKRLLKINEKQQKLSPKESKLLELLCEAKGEILHHQEAMLKIWQKDDYFTKQSMNVFITKLRKYLSEDPQHEISIESLHSKGISLKISLTNPPD